MLCVAILTFHPRQSNYKKQYRMNKIKLFRLLLALPLALMSCDDDSGRTPIIGEIIPPTPQSYNEIKVLALTNNTQTFILETDDTGQLSFISNNGVHVTLLSACLSFEGNPVEGLIEARFVEVFDQGNLLTTAVATMGKHTDQSLEMLVSDGVFYLSLYQNEQLLDLDYTCGYTMLVPTSPTVDADDEMELWYGSFDQNQNLIWKATDSQGQSSQPIDIQEENYYLQATQFGWTSIGRFYNNSSPQTTFAVNVPQGYNADNSSVYLLYKGINGVARLDYHSESEGFSEQYGKIPVGLQGWIIFVSEHQSQWVYAMREVEIEEELQVEILQTELKSTSQLTLNNLINNLP